MSEIVKVQAPQFPRSAPYLIYDESRDRRALMARAFIPEAAIKAMGEDTRGYFRATWCGEKGWELHERVEDQPW